MSEESIKKNIAKNITKYRELANLSQKELAKRLNITPSRISNWEQGANCPTIDILFDVCDALNVSINDIYGVYPDSNMLLTYDEINHIKKYRDLDLHGKDMVDTVLEKETDRVKNFGKLEDRQIISLIEIAARRESTRILPYWENGVSAGNGIYQLNDTSCVMMHLWATELTKQADFIIKVSGSSMEPDYHDGDKVLVDRKVNVNIGEVGIFVRNGETYIKELGIGELISRNPEYENIPVRDFDNVVCMGKVIGVLTDSMVAKE